MTAKDIASLLVPGCKRLTYATSTLMTTYMSNCRSSPIRVRSVQSVLEGMRLLPAIYLAGNF